jgi:hypothetical protein
MRKVEISLVVLIIGVIAAITWDSTGDPLIHRQRYRGEVRALYANLQLGMTKEQVRREMETGKYPDLRFYREGQLWLGSAPYQFGAGNWVLAIAFQGDQVSAIRIRKGDGVQDVHHPDDAPPDKEGGANGQR